MSLSCECGAYRSYDYRDGSDVCRYCGNVRRVVRQPLMLVTGGAASGKSTVCRAWEDDRRVFALDLDVVGLDPFIRRPGDSNFVGLWGFNLRLALEVQLNGLAPLLCGACKLEQIFANPEAEQFAGVHVLALLCDEGELLKRIASRPGGKAAMVRPDVHADINRRLRDATLGPPHSITFFETSGRRVEDTTRFAREWVEGLLEASGAADRLV